MVPSNNNNRFEKTEDMIVAILVLEPSERNISIPASQLEKFNELVDSNQVYLVTVDPWGSRPPLYKPTVAAWIRDDVFSQGPSSDWTPVLAIRGPEELAEMVRSGKVAQDRTGQLREGKPVYHMLPPNRSDVRCYIRFGDESAAGWEKLVPVLEDDATPGGKLSTYFANGILEDTGALDSKSDKPIFRIVGPEDARAKGWAPMQYGLRAMGLSSSLPDPLFGATFS